MPLQNRGTFDPAQAERELEEIDKLSQGKRDFFKFPPDSESQLRILPPKEGKELFIKVSTHFVRLPDRKGPVVFACPRRMTNEECPLCEQADKLMKPKDGKRPSRVQRDKAYKLYPRVRVYFNAIDRDDEKAGPYIVGVGSTVYKKLMKLIKRKKKDITDPERGYDIVVERAGSDMEDTEYDVWLDDDPTELGPDGDKWFDEQDDDLARFAAVLSPDEIYEKLEGDDEGDDDKPKRVRGGKERRSLRSGDDDDDDDEPKAKKKDDDEEPIETTARERKRRPRRGRSRDDGDEKQDDDPPF